MCSIMLTTPTRMRTSAITNGVLADTTAGVITGPAGGNGTAHHTSGRSLYILRSSPEFD